MKDSIGGKNFRPAHKPETKVNFTTGGSSSNGFRIEEFSRKSAIKRLIGEIFLAWGSQGIRDTAFPIFIDRLTGHNGSYKAFDWREIIFPLLREHSMLGARKPAGAKRCFR